MRCPAVRNVNSRRRLDPHLLHLAGSKASANAATCASEITAPLPTKNVAMSFEFVRMCCSRAVFRVLPTFPIIPSSPQPTLRPSQVYLGHRIFIPPPVSGPEPKHESLIAPSGPPLPTCRTPLPAPITYLAHTSCRLPGAPSRRLSSRQTSLRMVRVGERRSSEP